MARKISHQLVDDLDGEVLEAGTGSEVTFRIDGVTYEIDLSDNHAEEFREKLQPCISAARVTIGAGQPRRGRARGGRRRVGSGRDLAAIRTSANANGHTVSDRGRVPESVLQAYDAGH